MDLIETYRAVKDMLLHDSGVSDSTMHVHVGLAIYVIAQVLLRTRRGSINALYVVFVLEMANEAMDRLYWGSWRPRDTTGDVLATMFWPTTLALVSLYRRRRWQIVARSRAAFWETIRRSAGPEFAHAHAPHRQRRLRVSEDAAQARRSATMTLPAHSN